MASADRTGYLNGQQTTTNGNTGHQLGIQELDALIVGAGFSGAYQLKKLRDRNFKVKLVEAGGDYGGVWYWNRYPGARVDTNVPHYEFSDPALQEGWSWSQRFPGSGEIRAYFAHVVEKWDLKKDTQFNTVVSSAVWDGDRWIITTEQGEKFKAKFLLLNIGFAAKRYIPDLKGVEKFKGKLSGGDVRKRITIADGLAGTFIHPSLWPHQEPELRGKKIAVIGTGATAVQIIQDLSKVADQLIVFQRTPNTALPMKQINYSESNKPPGPYADQFITRMNSFGGFDFNFLPRSTFDDTPEQRQDLYEKLWAEGDFKYWLATYQDMLFVKEANREAYNFWRDKTRAKLHDPRVADLLAPMEQLYAFGCKRIPLENGYFEIFNQPNVSLIDLNATPIQEITEKGINTTESELEFDYIICATGYDAATGGITQIDIKGPSGESLKEHWQDGVKTYLGLSVSGFPNMFFSYGAQGPTPLCNGPTCAELQGNWIIDVVQYVESQGLKKIEAQAESEKKWRELVISIANTTLLPTTKSVCDLWHTILIYL